MKTWRMLYQEMQMGTIAVCHLLFEHGTIAFAPYLTELGTHQMAPLHPMPSEVTPPTCTGNAPV